MPTASALSLASGSFVQDLQRQQAQRSAEQASQNAQSLQGLAREARQEAARAQQAARDLEIRAGQAQAEAARASSGLKAAAAIETAQSDLNAVAAKLPERIAAASADTYGANAAVSTSTGNVGILLNTTA
jgi:hypothetical protein